MEIRVNNDETLITTTFYKFINLVDLYELKLQLIKFCNENKIKGTILLAKEGINSTISGTRLAIDKLYQYILSFPYFTDLEFKESLHCYQPFKRMKVKIKEEIITFKVALDMDKRGKYLDSKNWDTFLNQNDILLIDTRNDYEVAFGTFRNAINPSTKNFTDFPIWAESYLNNCSREKPVLMYCTGGVRCEKSTAYLIQKMGFKEVYHLKGGILKYLKDSQNKNNNWIGSCFVFDDRLAVDSNLSSIEDINNE
jgi:UPF0176 protein